MASHLRLVPDIDQEISELPDFGFASPNDITPESSEENMMKKLEICEYVLAHCPNMNDKQCHVVLKKFDGDYLKVIKTDQGILVLDPENPNHHLQSVRKRLLDLCQNNRQSIIECIEAREARSQKK